MKKKLLLANKLKKLFKKLPQIDLTNLLSVGKVMENRNFKRNFFRTMFTSLLKIEA